MRHFFEEKEGKRREYTVQSTVCGESVSCLSYSKCIGRQSVMNDLQGRETKSQKGMLRLLLLMVISILVSACQTEGGPVKVRNTSRSFKTVVLDAGHGGHDSGARTRKGILEKDLALDVIQRIAPKLQAAGFRTVLTRNSDVFIPLDDRVRISGARHNAIFVSVHFNDAGRKPVVGVESYYFSPESAQLASRLVRTLSQATGSPNRGPRVARFRVVKMNENPAVLMECGYLTTAQEAAWVCNPEYRERIAEGIARGIIEQRGSFSQDVE